MSRGTRILAGLVALAAGLVFLPAVAVSETTPTIEALDSSGYYGEQHHSWSPSVASVAAGGAVTFANNSSEVKHGLEWTGTSGQQTPTCSAGVPVGSFATNWRGQCTFSQPGTYTFRCTVHPAEMTGTITVSANGTVTTTTPTQPGGTTSQPESGAPPVTGSNAGSNAGSNGSPSAASPLSAVSVPARQHGSSVHGSVVVSQAAAGGRLEVSVLAKGASLGGIRSAQVRVGRLVRAALPAGTSHFAVPLSARARHALKLHRRLALTLAIVFTPAHGPATKVTRAVVVQI